MVASDRPEQDELNKRMMEQRKLIDAGKKRGKYRKAQIYSAEWEEFMLGCDPAWYEYKGPIKQDDD
jgi:hypothetical protein